MNTMILITAALSYSIGGCFMKLSEGLTRPWPTAMVLILFLIGASLQMFAMRYQEMTTTYLIVLGLEGVGAFILGTILFSEPLSLYKVLGALIVCVGIFVLRS